MEDIYLKLNYIEITQPIGTFYVTKMDWKELLLISTADIRHIENENSNSFDSCFGIQRELSSKRVIEIGKYVQTFDATFPTGIILAIPSRSLEIDGKPINFHDFEMIENKKVIEHINIKTDKSHLYIRKSKSIASILDGQHRIEGLKKGLSDGDLFQDPDNLFELNVTIFIDLDLDNQAQIFSVINKAQTKVNKSLVYDLYEYAKSRSPQKVAHDMVRILNRNEESPFYKKIKILGKANDKESETIAQATLVELIIKYFSNDPMKDRDLLKKKKKMDYPYDRKRQIFRDLFIEEKDEYILNTLWNFFGAVSQKWIKAWNNNEKGNILNKSTGIIALMRLLKDIFINIEYNKDTTMDKYIELFSISSMKDEDFSPENYLPGSSGQSKLYKDLKDSLNL